ncbi:matrix metalloproteinase-19-like [Saccostrea echinata]|uniref:matrix metalloproteinase-19-like n=1 Tax=Saccostrea echinata TaxID=191078 RepID=UPI002A801D5D|nr:matrix metalloproteinase-19-like [Saccostrea echinata]
MERNSRNSGSRGASFTNNISFRQCGNTEVYHKNQRHRRSSKVLKWHKDNLTWGVVRYSTQIRPLFQWRTFQKAFRIWARHSYLRFKYSHRKPDIKILFARLEHGDGDYNAFDGRGKLLGHAFKPANGGTHFDDDERWTLKSGNFSFDQIHLPTVALHEIGHALGLEHISPQKAVMAPYFTSLKMKLTSDDIAQLRELYDRRRPAPEERKLKETFVSTSPPSKEEVDNAIDSCKGIRDLTTVPNRKGRNDLQIFTGNLTFQVSSSGKKIKATTWTSSIYNGVPGDADAASFYKETGMQYFFKGKEVWKFHEHRIAAGFPKTVKMHSVFETPRASVSVTLWHSTRLFLFGSHTYWEWNPRTDDTRTTKPKPTYRHWRGLPDNIDAALQWRDRYVYFFKDEKYYKVHPSRKMVLYGYPKPMPPPWLRRFCQSRVS